MSYDQRNEFINQALMLIPSVHIVDTHDASSEVFAKQLHKVNLNKGYEGSIVRTNDVYKCGRSWSLRKFKDFSDAEATIIGYLDGKGKRTGTLGKFIMQDDEGIEFGCPPGKGYTYKDLKNMLDNISDYIGQRATFTFFERTKAGSYRHPLFKCIRNYE
jgi:DNA ligase-1